MAIDFKSGAACSLSMSCASFRGTGHHIEFFGEDGTLISEEVDDPTELLHRLTGDAIARGKSLADCSVVRPSLEDVYLELTADEASEVPQ